MEKIELLGSEDAYLIVGVGLDVVPGEHKRHCQILAAGPLVKQDKMTIAYRPVLWINSNGEFCIHDQYFPNIHADCADGSYFDRGAYPGPDFHAAMEAWKGRVDQQNYHCGRLTQTA